VVKWCLSTLYLFEMPSFPAVSEGVQSVQEPFLGGLPGMFLFERLQAGFIGPALSRAGAVQFVQSRRLEGAPIEGGT
jgi:hypothetical protein